ncbi:hypothetical protein FOA52_009794 [Chlamydomonas sp. UWO 241]|nr:hypothetical protein FOA52_009794 [Chlamydomonas sp. UWO 241]
MSLALNADIKVIVSAAGAIPPLVQLLGPGSSALAQEIAAGALMSLALNADDKVTIVAAGAIPPLVQLAGSRSRALRRENAAALLAVLAASNANNHRAIVAAGASDELLQQVDELGTALGLAKLPRPGRYVPLLPLQLVRQPIWQQPY